MVLTHTSAYRYPPRRGVDPGSFWSSTNPRFKGGENRAGAGVLAGDLRTVVCVCVYIVSFIRGVWSVVVVSVGLVVGGWWVDGGDGLEARRRRRRQFDGRGDRAG